MKKYSKQDGGISEKKGIEARRLRASENTERHKRHIARYSHIIGFRDKLIKHEYTGRQAAFWHHWKVQIA